MSSKPHDDSGAEEGDIFSDWEEEDVPSADDPGWSWNGEEDEGEGTEAEDEDPTDTNDRVRDEAGSGLATENDSTDVASRGGTGQSSTDTDLQMGSETVERLRSRQVEIEAVAESDLPAQRIATELLSILQQQSQST
jgi:hypothetical protein